MVDQNPPVEPGGGIRRRRSIQTDDDEILPLPRPTSEPINTIIPATTTTAQNAAASSLSLNTAVMPSSSANSNTVGPRRSASRPRPSSAVELTTDVSTTPLDPNPRTVRFSAEIDAQTLPAEFHTPLTSQSPRNSVRNSRGPQGLTVRVPENDVIEEIEPRVGSPRGSIKSILRSPQSPTSRNRGYSLRSNLFRRNMETPGTLIEMEETPRNTAGSSSSLRTSAGIDSKGSSQKSPGTFVSISQIESESSGEGASSDGKKSKNGLSTASVLPNYYSAWAQNRKREGIIQHTVKRVKKHIKKTILRIQEVPPSKDGRHIMVDASRKKPLIDDRTGKTYIENWIRSTRYTIHTFLPRQLVAQFSKLANFYFLCVAILQMIPGFSTTGKATTLVPLLFFVGISMGKEGYDDFRRYKLDTEENAREATILHAYLPTDAADRNLGVTSQGLIHWASIKWSKLRVGDIIKLKRDEAIPADIVLLHAEGENHVAYVETMALDGETNLKSKITPAALGSACSTEDLLAHCRAEFVCEDPNPNLYAFEGRVTIGDQTLPLTNTEIIYRGSILRNTPEAIGMVIYTGEECKIRMNANKNPRTKAPKLQFMLNRIVAIVVIFVLCLALFNSLAYLIWRRKNPERRLWYLKSDKKLPYAQVLSSFFIMFSTMIPLSLYVSMEIIKLSQMFLLSDIDMYDEKTNTPFEARTSTINEELGQVTHIFSDKTGTLTDNEMKFRKISIAGTVWLHDVDLHGDDKAMMMHKKRSKGKKPAKNRKSFASDHRKSFASTGRQNSFATGEDEMDQPRPSGEPTRWHSSARPSRAQPERSTMELVQYLRRRPDTAFAHKTRLLLLSIALCHTCLPERKADGSISFQSSSPDELALVQAAQELGYLIINREHGLVTLRLEPSSMDSTAEPIEEVYEILNVVEFSSERKRMSVVVRFPDGRICVICKGADNVIMKRLKLATLAAQKANDVERKANRRKSMEAQVALARRSTQIDMDRNDSVRRSFSMSNPRLSISGAPRGPARAEVDSWLRNRETDVEIVGEEQAAMSARFSAQLNRMSVATSEGRSSMAFEFDDELVDDSYINDDALVIERCFQHINDFATEGLRTLLYAYRFMEEHEYQDWAAVYLAASTSLSERDEKVQKAGEMIEYDFDLAGATAIEDKLQAGVPETIDRLRRANISMWMLTGDKRETAINIGHSCRLIKDYSVVIVLDKEIGEVEQHIAAGILSLQNDNVAHSVIVIDGMTLSTVTQFPHIEHLFMDLAVLSDSVICCRAQPSQKALLVKAIRKRIKNSITLAIGDGANDIAMIQEAHVGIGITGKEGLQAARTSDYSIAQFRFLSKLLLVHGRWNYIRTCKYILGTLWKEILFFLTQAVYQRYNGFAGTSLYEPWSLATFNTLFTSLPVLVMGIFEKDLAASTLIAVPELYKKGQRNGAFNIYIYAGWMAMGAAESLLTVFLMLVLFAGVTSPLDTSLFAMGDLTFVAVVIVINMKMQLVEQHNKSILAIGSFVISLGAVFLWNIILAALYPRSNLYRVRDSWFVGFGRNPAWWLSLVLIIGCIALFEYGVATMRATMFPTDTDIFQELEKDPEIKKRFEEAAAMELQQGWNAAAEADSDDEEDPDRTSWQQKRKRRSIMTRVKRWF